MNEMHKWIRRFRKKGNHEKKERVHEERKKGRK